MKLLTDFVSSSYYGRITSGISNYINKRLMLDLMRSESNAAQIYLRSRLYYILIYSILFYSILLVYESYNVLLYI